MPDEEGMDITTQFTAQFGKDTAATERRLAAERRAGRTAKQRAASKEKPPAKTQVNFRATAETRAQIDALQSRFKIDQTAVIAMAIEALARSARQ
jgi:hypothetical protein